VIEVSSQVFVSHAVSEKLNFGAKTAAWASGAPRFVPFEPRTAANRSQNCKRDIASRDFPDSHFGYAA
jgi:hypothetical protein